MAKRGLRGECSSSGGSMGGRRREKRNSVSITVLTGTAHCGPLPTTGLPSPLPMAPPWQVLAHCYAVRAVPDKLPFPAQYQCVQLVLELLVGPLGCCVAVLQPTQAERRQSLVKSCSAGPTNPPLHGGLPNIWVTNKSGATEALPAHCEPGTLPLKGDICPLFCTCGICP